MSNFADRAIDFWLYRSGRTFPATLMPNFGAVRLIVSAVKLGARWP